MLATSVLGVFMLEAAATASAGVFSSIGISGITFGALPWFLGMSGSESAIMPLTSVTGVLGNIPLAILTTIIGNS